MQAMIGYKKESETRIRKIIIKKKQEKYPEYLNKIQLWVQCKQNCGELRRNCRNTLNAKNGENIEKR